MPSCMWLSTMVRLDNHETSYISVQLFQAAYGKPSVIHWISLLVITTDHPPCYNNHLRAKTNTYQSRQSVSTEEYLGTHVKRPHETREKGALIWNKVRTVYIASYRCQPLSSMHHTALRGQHLVKGKGHCLHLILHARL